jgi:hypothetical protein
MRPYLYLSNSAAERRLTASGIELSDMLPALARTGGLFLLRHRFDWVNEDPVTGFDYVAARDLPQLAAADIHTWGDFFWADYAVVPQGTPPRLPDDSIAELLYFAHAGRPLRETAVPGVGNRFLAWAHDDGWRLDLRYIDWGDVEEVLTPLLPGAARERVLASLGAGDGAHWIQDGKASPEDPSDDIDEILRRRQRRN